MSAVASQLFAAAVELIGHKANIFHVNQEGTVAFALILRANSELLLGYIRSVVGASFFEALRRRFDGAPKADWNERSVQEDDSCVISVAESQEALDLEKIESGDWLKNKRTMKFCFSPIPKASQGQARTRPTPTDELPLSQDERVSRPQTLGLPRTEVRQLDTPGPSEHEPGTKTYDRLSPDRKTLNIEAQLAEVSRKIAAIESVG